jgi:hypothetical protein
MVEVGKPSRPHGNCLAWPEYPPRWLVAPSAWSVERNFTGVTPNVIAAIAARGGVCAVVLSHHAPFLTATTLLQLLYCNYFTATTLLQLLYCNYFTATTLLIERKENSRLLWCNDMKSACADFAAARKRGSSGGV